MVEIGKYNTLKIVKDLDFGVYLDGGDDLEILLPARYVPRNVKPGDEVEVFIYHDNEGRIIATTAKPLAIVGEFQWMECKSVNDMGAFLEWGLMKDLLVPFREQKMPMREGKWYLVYVHLDHVTKRIVASARVDKFLDNIPPVYEFNQEVDLLVADETEIGYKVIINNLHWGLVYHNEIYRRLERGEHLKGYIKEVREDEKIDVSLTRLGYEKVEGIAGIILDALKVQKGFLPVHDKSPAEEIYSLFGCSKKSFKQAIGALYKKKLISIEPAGIRLIETEDTSTK
ncbi:MAG TPA: S1-like domain-containing RNA-binding protein [Macellibacteroides fermentans]|uniref:CvfB family protein n=1 Tax=Macellibacteroides fermentans TaxID=879969 RepID=UPI002CBD3237|nr:S1-like domain-containing RNA-binding protein [Macellibacteroides fermentans]